MSCIRPSLLSLTRVSRPAETDVVPDLVHTGGSVPAGPRHAFIYLDLAALALESRHAEAGGAVPSAAADGAVAARVGGAMVHLFLARTPSVTLLTDACIPRAPVLDCQTADTLPAQPLSAELGTGMTVLPQQARLTLAN